jgi:hypothetical protein
MRHSFTDLLLLPKFVVGGWQCILSQFITVLQLKEVRSEAVKSCRDSKTKSPFDTRALSYACVLAVIIDKRLPRLH